MLVNMMGIEDDDLDLGPSTSDIVADPKSRDTLTTLFGALLSSFVSSGKPAGRSKVTVQSIGERVSLEAPGDESRVSRDAA